MTINKAAALLQNARNAVVLTGAGVSTHSGIPDFRSPDSGLWHNTDPHIVASIYGFRVNPQAFYDWIRPVARLMRNVEPNPAHQAIAQLEKLGIVSDVITQNIDMLHRRAGSSRVHEVHGTMATGTCLHCYRRYPVEEFIEEFIETGEMPRCPLDRGLIKPDVVLFGEALPFQTFDDAQQAVRAADVMIVAGSSLEVAPISGLPQVALAYGASLIMVNYEETYIDDNADVVIHEDVAKVLPAIVDCIEKSKHG